MTVRLSERAMRASLRVGTWAANLTDREVTQDTGQRYDAKTGAGRYTKQLVAHKYLRHVTAPISRAQSTHRLLTLPWDDDARILSSAGYQTYTQYMRVARLDIEKAADEFCNGIIKEAIVEAETRLGKMFNADEYPSADEIRKKYYIDVEFSPLPEGGDFRTKLSDNAVKSIVKDIERRERERTKKALAEVFERVAKVTGNMVERLRNPQAKFQDSLVFNVSELANLLPKLNITDDKRLNELQQKMLNDLTAHSPEVLRTDTNVRQKTADKADKILAKVNQYLAA